MQQNKIIVLESKIRFIHEIIDDTIIINNFKRLKKLI